MSILTTHTTASRASHSTGLCKFNTTSKAVEVSDGTNWLIYDYNSIVLPYVANSYAVSYDGTDDYHEISLDGTSSGGVLATNDTDIELTISAWIKPIATGKSYLSWAGTSTSGTPFFFLQNNRIFVDGSYRNFSTSLTQNSWNHVLITRTASNNNWNVFLNGNSTAVVTYSDSGTPNFRSSATDFFVGSGFGGVANCVIDELAFWNSDKSSELANIYGSATSGSGSPTNVSGLSPYGWWRMGDNESGVADGGSAGTIINASGSANDMTVGGGSPTYTNSVV